MEENIQTSNEIGACIDIYVICLYLGAFALHLLVFDQLGISAFNPGGGEHTQKKTKKFAFFDIWKCVFAVLEIEQITM